MSKSWEPLIEIQRLHFSSLFSYHFALDGASFDHVRVRHPSLLRKVITRAVVFARMSPEMKQLLVEELQNLGYYIGMCGDGANDCGALKVRRKKTSFSKHFVLFLFFY